MKQIMTWVLLAALATTYTACKKKKDDGDNITIEEEITPAFTVYGHQHIHANMRFTSNFTEKQRLKFTFGDGTVLSVFGIEAHHKYTEPGTYAVSMEAEGFTGIATQTVTITSGADRMSGSHKWNLILSKRKLGYPLNHFPVESVQPQMELNIVDNNTIIIPDIPKMRFPGPYTVTLSEVTPKAMTFRSSDSLIELSYDFEAQRAGLKMVQVSNDTTWNMDGFADIFK